MAAAQLRTLLSSGVSRCAVLVLAAAVLAAPAAAEETAPPKGRLVGTVTVVGTSEPVAGATVSVLTGLHITRVLRQWPDKREAAKRLRLGLSSLYRKIEELGIDL